MPIVNRVPKSAPATQLISEAEYRAIGRYVCDMFIIAHAITMRRTPDGCFEVEARVPEATHGKVRHRSVRLPDALEGTNNLMRSWKVLARLEADDSAARSTERRE